MTFEEFTRHFEVKKRGNNSVQAICPEHDDHQASLTITRGTDRGLMYCHALVASINAFRTRYGMQLDFCRPETTGKVIHDILYRELKEYLEKRC